MQRQLVELVRQRAVFRCEYCHFPERFTGLNFQIDHVIAEKHGGPTDAENLALSCIYCNSYKGANLSGIDPVTGEIARLFHPQRDRWGEHFGWAIPREPVLAGGAETAPLVMRSTLGYTGVQARMQMLQNKEFVDAKVEIFLKQGSKVWAKLAEYPIQRQLLTR